MSLLGQFSCEALDIAAIQTSAGHHLTAHRGNAYIFTAVRLGTFDCGRVAPPIGRANPRGIGADLALTTALGAYETGAIWLIRLWQIAIPMTLRASDIVIGWYWLDTCHPHSPS
jgi:hypothetical protein